MFIPCSNRKWPAKIFCDDKETEFEFFIKFDKTTKPQDYGPLSEPKKRGAHLRTCFSIDRDEFLKKMGDSIDEGNNNNTFSNSGLRMLGDMTPNNIQDQDTSTKFGQSITGKTPYTQVLNTKLNT